ncbi:MAG: TatD family hydrolase [Candidatus Tectomicrobia bacterium]|uniref:TatD family hydrolase n=1 Tax=Tectimicrobiota bacterium TaxID=2528274 RepID=A0A932CQH7_UNCTE|nr:TatD family hydrolase [Candidatus Tectomicrobia bacterium]
MRIFDAHIHSDCRGLEDFHQMALCGTEAVVTCAHDSLRFSAAASILDHFQRLLDWEIRRIEQSTIRPYVALGIHPMALPLPGTEEVLRRLPELLTTDRVVALGEVGLQKGDGLEIEVLTAQLEIARMLDLPVILHNPEKRKGEVTRQLLTVVAQVGLPRELVLIDHVNEETIETVREAGTWVGLSVHPFMLSPQRAAELIRKYGADRVILSSDVASASADIYALPRTGLELRRAQVNRETIERCLFQNARTFYRVDWS